jgi:hypothetical protein
LKIIFNPNSAIGFGRILLVALWSAAIYRRFPRGNLFPRTRGGGS